MNLKEFKVQFDEDLDTEMVYAPAIEWKCGDMLLGTIDPTIRQVEHEDITLRIGDTVYYAQEYTVVGFGKANARNGISVALKSGDNIYQDSVEAAAHAKRLQMGRLYGY